MAWSGIFLVHVPDGVTPRQAVDATIVGWVANPNVLGSHLMAAADPVEIKPDPRWGETVQAALLSLNPNLRVTDDGYLDDEVGPVMIYIYTDEVQLMPKKQWDEPDDMDGFAVMWNYCTALADATGCVAHDPDDDEIIDLSLDLRTARRTYRWI